MSILTRATSPTATGSAIATRPNPALDKSGKPRAGMAGWPVLLGEGNVAALGRFALTAGLVGLGGSAVFAALTALATGDKAALIGAWVFAALAGLIACAGFIRFVMAGWVIAGAAFLTGAGKLVVGREDGVELATAFASRAFLLAVALIPVLVIARAVENRSSAGRRRAAWGVETGALVLAPLALAAWVPDWSPLARLLLAVVGLALAGYAVKAFLSAEVRESALAGGSADLTPEAELEPAPAEALRHPAVATRPVQAEPPRRESLGAVLAELDAYPGLQVVKTQVRELVDLLTVNQARKEQGLKSDTDFGHISFNGEPGTGKTEMARLVARVLATTGVVKTGHFVETSRAALVGEYQGHTARAVETVFFQALGGVLFIDEAYSLFGGKHDAFGIEALATLLALMENHRGEIVVIFAGYEREMAELMTANPGLASRIERTVTFPSYEPAELLEIADKFARDKGYIWTQNARQTLLERLTTLHRQRDEHWGNAREVRRIFNGAVRAHGVRLASHAGQASREALETLTSDDVHASVDAFILARDAERRGRAASAPKSPFEWTR